jgi:hypothetical protein
VTFESLAVLGRLGERPDAGEDAGEGPERVGVGRREKQGKTGAWRREKQGGDWGLAVAESSAVLGSSRGDAEERLEGALEG